MKREHIEEIVGKTWTTKELEEEFDVKGFVIGLCVAERKSDGVIGSLDFNRSDDAGRLYHSFVADPGRSFHTSLVKSPNERS